MQKPRLLEDILNQPQSLARVLAHQLGGGRPALREAAAALRTARRIVLTGMGASRFACVPLQYYLASRGFACEVLETAEVVHYLRGAASNAAVVLVSRSGETVEVRKLLEALDPHALTVGVTSEAGSTLARTTRHPICVGNPADDLVAIQSYTGTVLALLLLGAQIAGDSDDRWRAAAESAIASLADCLDAQQVESLGWKDFLEPANCVYLLARGPSTGSALAGALLFNEVAKTPSVAMSAGEFRHGPVEVADAAFRALVFAPDGPTRALNLDLARDLASFGAQVRAIGPAAADGSVFWETPVLPEALSPLVEIAPVQLAALRLAEWKGLPPGRFRYVSHVTLAESGFAAPAP
jgi:glucosamine--fructose-6-phosphate aminotransferase (isomerizing)